MARHVEPLHGGVWSAPDPALLKPGQLSAGRNFVYLGGSPAIYRSWGRGVFGAVSATAVDVNGLRDAQFDGGDHIVIAVASSSYLTATAGDTSTFSVLSSGLAGVPTQLEAVQYRNRFYLLPGISSVGTGIGTNGVLYVSATGTSIPATLRQHGMVPVNTTPIVTTVAGTFSQTVTGKYWDYWTTEVAKIQEGGGTISIESTFVAQPHTQWVSATGVVPIIQRPTPMNSITTHWRVYRSPFKETATDFGFPVGYMIAENPAVTNALMTAVSAVGDTATNSSTALLAPGNANSGAEYFAGWASAASAFTDNGVFASATSGPLSIVSPVRQGYYGFNFGGFGGSVKGVEVSLQAYISGGTGPVPLTIFIAPNRQSNGNAELGNTLHNMTVLGQPYRYASKSVMISATTSGSPQTVTVGSPTDRWFPANYNYPLNSSDFNANLMVVAGLSHPSVSVGVDYIAARVFYNATVDSTIQFPNVVYTMGDEVVQVGKNSPPPSSSCGDIFQDSLELDGGGLFLPT